MPVAPTGAPEATEATGPAVGDGRSVQRVVSVLEFVAARATATAPGVVEIARGVGLEKSVASRHLRTLVDTGLLARDDGLGYRIGPRLFAVAAAAQDARLVELGERVVAELADRFGERAELYTRTGNVATTVATASPDSPLQVTGWVGRTYSLTGSAAGRALLLDQATADVRRLVATAGIGVHGPNAPKDVEDVLGRLAADRARGLCVAVEEVDRDLFAAAVPVRSARGRVIASLVIAGPVDRLRSRLGELGPELLSHAEEISTALGAATPNQAGAELPGAMPERVTR
jgi:DNA-binding IclR family transcriptional regulator